MTEQILSAGVYPYENDQSFYSQGNTTTGLALVGPTEKGAAFVPTDITSYSQFQAVFGGDTKASYVPQTAYSYLQAGSTVKVTRILGNGGFQYNSVKKLAALVSGSTILAVFYPTLNDAANTVNLNSASIAGTYATFSFSFGTSSYFTSTGFSASLSPTSNTYVTKVIGNDQNFQTGSVFPYLSFQNVLSATQLAGTVASVFTTTNCTFTSSNSNGYDHASTPWILSDGGVRLFKIHHKSDGFKTNQDVKISISNIIKGVDANTYSTFNVLVRKWDDTDKNVSVIEQFINVSLNPDAANYIVKVIGDTYFAYDTTQQRVIGRGDYANNSNYIRVEVTNGVAGGSIHPQVIPNGY